MNSIIDRQYFQIRSNQPSINLALDFHDSDQFSHCCVTSASIPKTYYVLPDDCTLIVTENGADTTIPLEEGNYNARSLGSILQTKMNLLCLWDYAISDSTSFNAVSTLKYQFSVSGNGGLQPSIRTSDSDLASCLGIVPDTTHTFVADKFKSPNVINFQSHSNLMICSDIVRNKEQLLQEIYTNGDAYGAYILYQCPDMFINSKRLSVKRSNVYNFSLQSSDRQPVDLNGSYWTMVLCLYRLSNSEAVIMDYIRYKHAEGQLLLEKAKPE